MCLTLIVHLVHIRAVVFIFVSLLNRSNYVGSGFILSVIDFWTYEGMRIGWFNLIHPGIHFFIASIRPHLPPHPPCILQLIWLLLAIHPPKTRLLHICIIIICKIGFHFVHIVRIVQIWVMVCLVLLSKLQCTLWLILLFTIHSGWIVHLGLRILIGWLNWCWIVDWVLIVS